jgi:outer membrane protein assembly factor BamD
MSRTFRSLFLFFAISFIACSGSEVVETPTAELRFRLGMDEFVEENYLEALNHFEVIRLQFPGSAVADSARLYTGIARFRREEFLMASYEFNQLIQSGTTRDLLPEAYFMFAQCYYEMSPNVKLDQTNSLRAIDALQNFVEAFPSHPKAQTAEKQVIELVNKLAEKEYNTGVLYENLENRESALVYYNTVVDRYYSTQFAEPAAAAKVRILVRLRRYAQAESAAKDFLERYPDSPLRSEVMDQQSSIEALRASSATGK